MELLRSPDEAQDARSEHRRHGQQPKPCARHKQGQAIRAKRQYRQHASVPAIAHPLSPRRTPTSRGGVVGVFFFSFFFFSFCFCLASIFFFYPFLSVFCLAYERGGIFLSALVLVPGLGFLFPGVGMGGGRVFLLLSFFFFLRGFSFFLGLFLSCANRHRERASLRR